MRESFASFPAAINSCEVASCAPELSTPNPNLSNSTWRAVYEQGGGGGGGGGCWLLGALGGLLCELLGMLRGLLSRLCEAIAQACVTKHTFNTVTSSVALLKSTILGQVGPFQHR
mmetsp:Transcript_5485/g.11958  ORF Transcript_5485/g.11958 Transcript_5485/m.11958 type:complete len:115 (-) Transcript_5485:483-827(-)